MPGMFEAMGEDADPFELVVARPGAGLYPAPTEKRAADRDPRLAQRQRPRRQDPRRLDARSG